MQDKGALHVTRHGKRREAHQVSERLWQIYILHCFEGLVRIHTPGHDQRAAPVIRQRKSECCHGQVHNIVWASQHIKFNSAV